MAYAPNDRHRDPNLDFSIFGPRSPLSGAGCPGFRRATSACVTLTAAAQDHGTNGRKQCKPAGYITTARAAR